MNFRYGTYPRNQRFALLLLLLAATVVCWLADRFATAGKVTNEIERSASSLNSALKAAEVADFRPPPAAFAFDPNTVTAEELVELGLSTKQAAGWLKFRGNRSNAFRQPEDIGKLYVLSEEDKIRLIPLAYVAEQQDGARPQVQGFAFDPNTVSLPDLQRLGLSRKQASAFLAYRSKAKYGRAFRQPEDLRRLGTLSDEQKDHLISLAEITPEEEKPTAPPQRFRFDPNTISADSFAMLGFPAWQAKSLLRYRGDRPVTFRRPTDLRRVKSLDSALVEAVLSLVSIAPEPSSAPASAPENGTAAAPKTYSYAPRLPLPDAGSFDVNTSDTTAWKSLPGIGSYRAKRIVRFREALGGFSSIDQIATTRGLPDSTFSAIRDFLKISPVPRPIPINRATYDELNKHPYINRNLANSIVQNRAKFGRFNGPEDLRRLRLITEDNLLLLLPYFSFE